jgi:hypothetical protein
MLPFVMERESAFATARGARRSRANGCFVGRCTRKIDLMKAVVCRQHGGPETLTVEVVPSPRPKAGELVVAVHAAAVNFADTLIIADSISSSRSCRSRREAKSPVP